MSLTFSFICGHCSEKDDEDIVEADEPQDPSRPVQFDADDLIASLQALLGPLPSEESQPPRESSSSSKKVQFDVPDKDEDNFDDLTMDEYMEHMDRELASFKVGHDFERLPGSDDDEEYRPVDVEYNLIKNMLASFDSQGGMPGAASNLMGRMGARIPDKQEEEEDEEEVVDWLPT